MNALYEEIGRLKAEIAELKREFRLEVNGHHMAEERVKQLEAHLKPIREVWEQFKHLDVVLSDEGWIKVGMTPQWKMISDLWAAIKKANT